MSTWVTWVVSFYCSACPCQTSHTCRGECHTNAWCGSWVLFCAYSVSTCTSFYLQRFQERDPDSQQKALLFEIEYPEARSEGLKSSHTKYHLFRGRSVVDAFWMRFGCVLRHLEHLGHSLDIPWTLESFEIWDRVTLRLWTGSSLDIASCLPTSRRRLQNAFTTRREMEFRAEFKAACGISGRAARGTGTVRE